MGSKSSSLRSIIQDLKNVPNELQCVVATARVAKREAIVFEVYKDAIASPAARKDDLFRFCVNVLKTAESSVHQITLNE